MADSSLLNEKKGEIRNLAKKYGVTEYMGTDKLAVVDAMTTMWAEDSKKLDPLTANSSWLDIRSEIEDVMSSLSLEKNSKEQLYLLGSSATGQVNFEEIKVAYIKGWNTLMEQYVDTISGLSQLEMMNLERERDRYLASLPPFGTQEEKTAHSVEAGIHLKNVEAMLKGLTSNSQITFGRKELAKRETTRSMILSQSDAGMKSGSMPVHIHNQIQNLVGRKNSLFNGQVNSLELFKNSPGEIFNEMDRVLRKASTLLSTQEDKFALAGISTTFDPTYKNFSKTLGRTGSTGDGIRVVTVDNRIMQTVPQPRGQGVPIHANPAFVFPNYNHLEEPTVIPSNNNNMAKFINPADVYRNDSMSTKFEQFRQSKMFGKAQKSPMVAHKTEGLDYNPLKGSKGVISGFSNSRIVQLGLIAGATYTAVQGLRYYFGTKGNVPAEPKKYVDDAAFDRSTKAGIPAEDFMGPWRRT